MPIVEQIEKIKSFSEKLPIVEQLNKISAAPAKMPIMEQIEKIKSFSEKLPITDEIEKINKISANTGISILELKEKLQSLQGGDFSKFKEIGVNMSKVPNQQLLEVDYKGNKQAISPNVGAVTDYILSLGDLQNTANTTSKSIFSTFETLTSNLNQVKYNVTSAYSTFKTNIIGNLLELSPAFASFYEQNETSLTQFENKVLGFNIYATCYT